VTYDPIANTISDPIPPCPFCGGRVRGNAINVPPFYRSCDDCGARIPAEHYRALCKAKEGVLAIQHLDTQARALRWQLRQVLIFYQVPPADILRHAGARYAVLIEAWRLAEGPL
jgi:hypothetical protein